MLQTSREDSPFFLLLPMGTSHTEGKYQQSNMGGLVGAGTMLVMQMNISNRFMHLLVPLLRPLFKRVQLGISLGNHSWIKGRPLPTATSLAPPMLTPRRASISPDKGAYAYPNIPSLSSRPILQGY